MEDIFQTTKNAVYVVLADLLTGIKPVEISEEEFYNETLGHKIPLGPAIRLDRLGNGETLDILNKKYGYLDKKYIGIINRSKDYLSAYDKEYGFIEVTMDDEANKSNDVKQTANVRIFVNPYFIDSSTEFNEKHIFETLMLILRLITSKYQTEGIFAYTTSASRALTTYYYVKYGNIIDYATGGNVLTKIHSDKHISVNNTIDTIQTMIENYNSKEILKFLNSDMSRLYTIYNEINNKIAKETKEYEIAMYKINNFIETSTNQTKKLEAITIKNKYIEKYKTQMDMLKDSLKNTELQIASAKEYFDYIKLLSVKVKKNILLSYFKFKKSH